MTTETIERVSAVTETDSKIGQDHKANTSNKSHAGKLIGVSGTLMALILPIGIVPRMMQSHELDQTQSKIAEHVPAVSITEPKLAPASRELSLPGSLEAILETPVYARTNGYVRQRFVDIGDKVQAGQLLVKMETPEIDDTEKESKAQVLTSLAAKSQTEANRDRAKADLDTAIAALAQARANVIALRSDENFARATNQRYKQLGGEGAVSWQDVDEKETRLKTSVASTSAAEERVNAARSEVIAARARLKAEEANISASSANIAAATAHAQRSTSEKSFQNVISPFAGVITERNIDQGTLISSGSDNSRMPMFRVARIDVVKVFVDVPQYAARGIHVGQTVDVSLKEFPGKTFAGKVVRTSVAMDPNARTLKTEIHIANANLALAPGMYADVNFKIARPDNVFLIPANSLIVRAEGTQVATLDSAKKIHYNKVQLGEDLGKEVEIVGGLRRSDEVIVNPSDTLVEGNLVAISH
jgi:RND family efflux transporter MFP subunit